MRPPLLCMQPCLELLKPPLYAHCTVMAGAETLAQGQLMQWIARPFPDIQKEVNEASGEFEALNGFSPRMLFGGIPACGARCPAKSGLDIYILEAPIVGGSSVSGRVQQRSRG